MRPSLAYVAVFVQLCFLQKLVCCNTSEERLIGWLGDTYTATKKGNSSPKPRVEVISWQPRALVFHDLITEEEARHIQLLAAPQMQRSTVVGPNGSSVEDSYRTSYGTFLNRHQDSVVGAIEDRVAAWTHLPVVHQEDIQVLRYAHGQKYGAHMDILMDGSPRIATILIYLSDPEEGGETAFPNTGRTSWVDPSAEERNKPWSDCAKGHVAFKAHRGDGLLFWSMNTNGEQDPHSMHAGCPVTKGVKWTTTIWIHSHPFRPEEYNPKTNKFREPTPYTEPGLCTDNSPRCKEWASAGECTKNPGFMVGLKGQGSGLGRCRLSCAACEVCAKEDADCFMRNRDKAGYLVYDTKEFDLVNSGVGKVEQVPGKV